MKHTTRFAALALTVAVTTALACPAAAQERPSDRQQSAQAAIEAAAQYGGAVSIQYALWEEGEITLTGHAGTFSRTENRALTDSDLYGVGSVSKIYTTAAVMQLVEQGKVDLDRPVTAYLPDFTMADPRYQNITVRMLLNHSSGLMGDSTRSAFLFDDYDGAATDELLARLSTQRLKADPGAYSVYCNDGFTLAELVVERVSGLDFSDYLAQNITGPLGLADTYTPAGDFDRDRLARIYQGDDTRALPTDTLNIVGTGGIYATASDLARFGGALCGEDLLTQSSLDAMANDEAVRGLWAPDSEDDMLGYGLGWDNVHQYPFHHSGIQALVKGGDTLYYHTGLVVLPQYDLAVAVVSSGGVSTYNELAGIQILLDALAARGVSVQAPASLPEAQPAAMPAELSSIAGTYAAPGNVLTVTVQETGITITAAAALGGGAQELAYYSDGSFRDSEQTMLVKFDTASNGRTYLYQLAYSQLPGLPTFGTANYGLERLEPNDPGSAAAQAWTARGESLYLLLNEKYTSQIYAVGQFVTAVGLLPEASGYAAFCRIDDANTASQYLTLPGTGSRSGGDLSFHTENGVDYLSVRDYLFMDAAAAPVLYTGPGAALSIQPNGYARWCQVGQAGGQTKTISIQGQGGFYVYDAQLNLTASSVLYGDASVTLPENGWLVFAGDAGTTFSLN
ncbi:class A beta-lactamase-related serine hydrolase [Pseudoflavonifractor sp. 524-17]|uniref:serine hydrolase domain-containing protein n=1 Tax=Pseudoflavonifractor sp. 524-17 TaxID=2304577 RepID=UPI00137A4B48|nr:serine hydrolase domain-containing protein [Pseudoflavonifractor sp. 524-17]NCE65383.1 class A beta-lactamase-related serine hydrolase [Pseudoflavonifractor sp. 524-17]